MYDFSRITERIYVGAHVTSEDDVLDLCRARVTHVIDCEQDDEKRLFAPFENNEKELFVQFPGMAILPCPTDDDQPKEDAWFKTGIEFALGALSFPGRIVLCHSSMGVNRAPSMAYAIMRALGWRREDVVHELHEHRLVTIGGVRFAADAERALVALGWVRAKP